MDFSRGDYIDLLNKINSINITLTDMKNDVNDIKEIKKDIKTIKEDITNIKLNTLTKEGLENGCAKIQNEKIQAIKIQLNGKVDKSKFRSIMSGIVFFAAISLGIGKKNVLNLLSLLGLK